MKVNFIGSYSYTLSSGYEDIKQQLIKSHRLIAPAAAYAVESSSTFPYAETFLPVAKRRVLKEIMRLEKN
jgi:hypothetical protein